MSGLTRRDWLSVPGLALALEACAAVDRLASAARALRTPLVEALQPGPRFRELVRCATLAPSGHNTQPWRFFLSNNTISIRPDFLRRTPVVDPDDHHLWVSLGCATENLAVAAASLGMQPGVVFAANELGVNEARIAFDPAPPVRSPLADAIFQRQCTRSDYDGQPLPDADLRQLNRAAAREGVQLLLLTERPKIETVIEYVTQGNSAQIQNAAFVNELRHWIRFNVSDALATGDGLFSGLTGNPALPHWLGNLLFTRLLSAQSENEKATRQLRSSAGVAIFAGEQAGPASWFEVGRAYERFALTATAMGVRTAFVNQPVEVPAVRAQFAQWLGLGAQRPDLVVRFGRGPRMPWSLRRPPAATIE